MKQVKDLTAKIATIEEEAKQIGTDDIKAIYNLLVKAYNYQKDIITILSKPLTPAPNKELNECKGEREAALISQEILQKEVDALQETLKGIKALVA
jgi:hypothetical protein